MRFDLHVFVLSVLFAMTGVLAQLSTVTTGDVPDVTYTYVDGVITSFVFCSDQNCSGTCEVVNSQTVAADDGHGTPDGMGYLSMYWYDPSGVDGIDLYTCISSSECTAAVLIGPNVCTNLYDNGVPTLFYDFFYFVIGGKM